MWQGIQAISDYKSTNCSSPSTDISFLNALNNFYAPFDRDNQEVTNKIKPPSDHQPLTLSSSEVSAALSRINAAGHNGIPGCVLRTYAWEVEGTLTDLFNLSLVRLEAYMEEVDRLDAWCTDNNFELNTKKTKELIVDLGRSKLEHTHPSTSTERWWTRSPALNSLHGQSTGFRLVKKAVFPVDSEKEPSLLSNPDELLLMCYWEYPDQLYYNLGWKMLCVRPESTPEGGENCPTPS